MRLCGVGDLRRGVLCLVVGDGFQKEVAGGSHAVAEGITEVVDIKVVGVWGETHNRTIGTMDHDGGIVTGRVDGDAKVLGHDGKRKYVGNGGRAEPYRPEIGKVSHLFCRVGATISVADERVRAVTDVREERCSFEYAGA